MRGLHEHVLVAPVTFEEAIALAQEEALKRNVGRIHVKHARLPDKRKAKAKPPIKVAASRPKKRGPAAGRTAGRRAR